jgi:Raf kinase inhibitor-like YbhB/YbcL family protein
MLEHMPEALGEALTPLRAGLEKTLCMRSGLRTGQGSISLRSPVFADHAPIPARYTADGEGMSPPLYWEDETAGVDEWALIVEDADSPTPQPFVHAIVTSLQRNVLLLDDGAMGGPDGQVPAVPMGQNSLLQTNWLPPDPPPGHGLHRYLFQVFALRRGEPVAAGAGRDALRQIIEERALASGWLVGTYERSNRIELPTAAAGAVVA